MSMNIDELSAESAELLPGREALTKFSGFNFTKTVNVTKHIAHINASNDSLALNQDSPCAVAQSSATQNITVSQ